NAFWRRRLCGRGTPSASGRASCAFGRNRSGGSFRSGGFLQELQLARQVLGQVRLAEEQQREASINGAGEGAVVPAAVVLVLDAEEVFAPPAIPLFLINGGKVVEHAHAFHRPQIVEVAARVIRSG